MYWKSVKNTSIERLDLKYCMYLNCIVLWLRYLPVLGIWYFLNTKTISTDIGLFLTNYIKFQCWVHDQIWWKTCLVSPIENQRVQKNTDFFQDLWWLEMSRKMRHVSYFRVWNSKLFCNWWNWFGKQFLCQKKKCKTTTEK